MQLVTLKKNREFGRVYSRGKSCSTKNMVLIYIPRRFGGLRVGFTVSKKVGGSVVRNKIRRRLKESLRTRIEGSIKDAHIVFVARNAIVNASFSDIARDMAYLLKKCGLLKETLPKEEKSIEKQ